ncbi:MAG: hypothetical protein ABR521_08575 [Gaiellaceae bacterium]
MRLRHAAAAVGAVAVALAAAKAVTEAPAAGRAFPGTNGRIAFVAEVRESLPALYTIGLDGRGRKRMTPFMSSLGAPAWSPHGSSIAFIHSGDLWVLTGGKLRRLTRGRRIISAPDWSPDGRTLAFVTARTDRHRDLYTVPAAGGPVRLRAGELGVLCPGVRGQAWSPDSTRIVVPRVTRVRGRLVQALRIVNVVTGRERALTQPIQLDALPSWSPDGRRVAFTRFAADPCSTRHFTVTVVDVATRALKELAYGAEPVWSPDGTKIAYSFYTRIYVIGPEGGKPVLVHDAPSGEWPDATPVWLPNSRGLVMFLDRELHLLAADGSGKRQITHERPRFLPGAFVSLSPDGRRAVYVSIDYDPGDPEIFTMRGDGSDVRRVTDNDLFDNAPAWSADGRRLAFVRDTFEGDSRPQVVVSDAGGGAQRVVARGTDPAWSPDGALLAFSRYGSLYLIGADGRNERLLLGKDGVLEATQPAWSPDGTKIAFSRGGIRAEEDPSDVYTIRPDGEELTRLSFPNETGRCSFSPAWSPDGAEVAYVSATTCYLDKSGVTIYATSLAGVTRRVTSGGNDYDPEYSPDGKRLLFSRHHYSHPWGLIVVPNGGGPEQRITPRVGKKFRYGASDPAWQPLP